MMSALRDLRDVPTNDGQLLVLTCMLTTSPAYRTFFPQTGSKLVSNDTMKRLLKTSSDLPPLFACHFQQDGDKKRSPIKGFCSTNEGAQVRQFLDVILKRLLPLGSGVATPDQIRREREQATMEADQRKAERRARQALVLSWLAILIAAASLVVNILEIFLKQ
jgi:hypothetical protein